MKTDEAVRNEICTALDRRLSSVVEQPYSQQKMLRLVRGEEKPMKKASIGFVIIIALLVLSMTVALATGCFGILDFRKDLSENQELIDHIIPLGQTYENEYLSIQVNETAFDGTNLTLTLDVNPKEDADSVYVIPTIKAEADGKQYDTFVEFANGDFSNGFWVPAVEGVISSDTSHGVIARLVNIDDNGDELPIPALNNVTWTISFDVFRADYNIVVQDYPNPSDDSDEMLTDNMDTDLYAQECVKAYENHQILLVPEGSLLWYIAEIPQADGIPGGEKSFEELRQSIAQCDAFTLVDQPVFTFATDSTLVKTAQAGQTFLLGGRYTVEVLSVKATYSRVEYSLQMKDSQAEGLSFSETCALLNPWDVAVLAEGAATSPFAGSGCVTEDGWHLMDGTVELSGSTDRLTFVLCNQNDMANAPDAVYNAQELNTDALRELTFTIDLK